MSEFDKVIGYKLIKTELMRMCDILKNPDKYKKLGVKFPKGLILYGDPGVGKTLFAECFLKESGFPYFICRKNKSNGGFIDKIRETFEEARKAQPSIILLDDMDKFANEDNNHIDAEEYVTVQACIDEVRDENVFVFATVNNFRKLPESLVRAGRFDKHILIKNPKGTDAVEIVKYYLSKKEFVGNVDAKQIARLLCGKSCAELESVINNAGIYAGFKNKEKIEMEDIIQACVSLVSKSSGSLGGEISGCDEEVVYHEAGHLVVAEILDPLSVTMAIVGTEESDAKGFVSCCVDEDMKDNFDYLKNIKSLVLLAGKAEVELKFGKYDSGSSEDVRKARFLIEDLIKYYGLFGFDGVVDRLDESEASKSELKIMVASALNDFYMQTKRILVENRQFVENIATALMEKKILLFDDIQEIKKNSGVRC